MLLTHMKIRNLSCLIAGLVFCLCGSLVSFASAEKPAQSETVSVSKGDSSKGKPSKSSEKIRKNSSPLNAEREKLALDFAKSHHPELAKLIQRLKKHKPREYKRAIRDLDNTLTRLERFKNRDGERYRLTLERWEIDSRIRLLAARVSVMGSSKDKSELKSLIKQRVDLQLELLKHDQKLAEKRVQKLQKSIEEIEQNRNKFVDAEFNKINRSIKKSGQKDKKQK
ncbi:hypothetical protein Pan241w_29810 [Gimesia alba]|uniref:Chromosome partition protein Smc n=1 Tax=Gimesia alba TaxID=2527973 RepID=A0A517RG80_9PLAN|nr:hypothetical protein [Gimesia alba]QDT42886.1 hypothetical protein Pan241w_29810 [Gimesia alba]